MKPNLEKEKFELNVNLLKEHQKRPPINDDNKNRFRIGKLAMGNSYSNSDDRRSFDGNRENTRGAFRGGRGPGGREGGGFRIRLSENEMRAAKSIQEAFQLRSTVAVLGFAVRTVGQMIAEGKVAELIELSKKQNTGDQLRRDSQNQGSRDKYEGVNTVSNTSSKPNPFERPDKPQINKVSSNEELQESDKESEILEKKIEDETNNTEGKVVEENNEISNTEEDLN